MGDERDRQTIAGARRPGIGLAIELRRAPAGDRSHRAAPDHWLSVHAGAPVGISCHGGGCRAVRTRGAIDIVPAGASDEWIEDGESETVELRLPRALVQLAAEEMGLDPDRAGLEPQCHLRDAQIEHLVWALEAERRADFPNGRIYGESLGLALAVHLLNRYRSPSAPRAGLSWRQLTRVVEYIDAHLADDLSLHRLARVAGLSSSHFRALFKRSTGHTVHEYVIRRRVERARALLVGGDLAASQVALDAGFAHQSHMARAMRRLHGVTPAAIRRTRAD